MKVKKLRLIIAILLTIIIAPMSASAKEKLINDEFELLAETTKYYKTITERNITQLDLLQFPTTRSIEITEEEYDAAQIDNIMQTFGSSTIETSYKKLVTSILSNGSMYRYKTTLTWKTMPKVRSYDSIAIGHYSSVRYNANFNFTQTYCLTSGTCKTLTTYYPQYFTAGASATFKVPEGNLSSLSQTLFYDVTKNVNATIISQKAYGDYSHATDTVTVAQAQNFTVGTSGIQFNDNTSNYYDEIDPAVATWSGTW